jgi:signal transduction histidine kinase
MIESEILGPLGNDTYRDYIREILSSGQRLLEVINDILDITRIESGRLKLEERVVEVDRVLETCEAEIAARAEKRGISVTFAHPPKPVSLRADPNRLQQIVLNLLSNAVKFSSSGAVVSVSADETEDGAFEISVRDSGIGMSEEELQRALLPFQQVDASLARRYEGTGLGLTITKSLVELHGGELEIASAPGEGTTATVRLPAQRQVRPAA